MLSPKKTKFRKYHRQRMRGKACKGNFIAFGQYGLQATEPTWLTSRQIEATRRTITRSVKRGGKQEWDQEKVIQNIGLPLLNLDISYLKLQVYQRKTLSVQCNLLLISYL